MFIKNIILKFFENHGKYRAMVAMRALPESVLEDVGISPALLAQGVRAWPWSVKEDNWEPRRNTFQKPVRAEMADLSDQTEVAANGERTAA